MNEQHDRWLKGNFLTNVMLPFLLPAGWCALRSS